MPKNGMLVRISLMLAAAAALATIAVSAAGAARKSVTLTGAGSTFVAPLIATWTSLPDSAGSPFTSEKGIAVTYGGGGSGAGVAPSRTSGRLRRERRAAHRVRRACTTCYQIPWALSGTAVIYPIDGVARSSR